MAANQNGSFEFVTDNNSLNSNYAIGFTTAAAGNTLADIEYGIEITNNGTNKIFVHESNATGIDLGAWVVGDYFKIDRQGTAINYYKNGVLIRTSTASSSKDYIVKSSLNIGKGPQVMSSFWIPASRGLIPDAWEFAVLKEIYDSLGGLNWTAKPNWPTAGNWSPNFTAAQMDSWFGIASASGDITEVILFQNNLIGKIPASVGNLKSLKRLEFYSSVGITGRIPSSIGNLTSLEYLYLYRNSLTGSIPASFRNLTKMQFLAFHMNDLTGNFDWIGRLTDMVQFYYYANPNLNCTIPSSIGKLTKMTVLAGGGWIAQPDMPYVHTKIQGTIPDSLGYCIKLQRIYLDNSEFSGTVPNSLSNLTDLRALTLFNNRTLSGNLDSFTSGLTKLTQVLIQDSDIGGSIPSAMLNSNLLNLNISKSKITTLPSTMTNAVNLLTLGLDSIKLTQIPDWQANFPKLVYLSVKNNQLTSFPFFTNHVNRANLEIFAQNNQLDFADLESSFTAAGVHPFKTFVYSPQQNPLPAVAILPVQMNTQLKIEAPAGGVHGVYLWEKLVNGSWVNVNAQNQSTVANQFVIENCQENEGGKYRYTVTNTWIPNLRFERGPIDVSITDAAIGDITPLYNGLITSVRWRTDKVHASTNDDFSGAYAYSYDDKYQIEDATFGKVDNGISFLAEGNKFRLTGMEYDPNGNIMALKRYDDKEIRIHNFLYTYQNFSSSGLGQNEIQTNKLKSVTGYTNVYSYNKIGQMIGEDKEAEGADQYVEYDVTGKVIAVFSDVGKTIKKVEYLYDDRGFRLAKVSFPSASAGSGSVARTTWYIRDASGNVISIYEQEGEPSPSNTNPLTQTEVPIYGSGKLGTHYPDQDGSTNYEITDHLGNVRALVRENVNVYTATMEDNEQEEITNPRVEEIQYFDRIFETEVTDSRMNHTVPVPTYVPTPNKAAYLNWISGMIGQDAIDKSVGPSIALRVSAGDKVDLETWARYENKVTYTHDLTPFLVSQFLGAGFAYATGFETSSATQTAEVFNNAFNTGGFFGDGDDLTRPFAYLNYIVFDQNMQYVIGDGLRVPIEAGFTAGEEGLPDMHKRIALEQPLDITQNGFIYIWVSNESENTKVWFDDLKITLSSELVTQASDYGVWGDVLREQKSDESKYRFGYQGHFAEKDEETGVQSFKSRELDPLIGRWKSVDPKRQFYSPYLGMGNNPISGFDPDGGDVVILSAPQGARSFGINFGHAAMLVGNDDTGWYYVSKDGTDWFGGSLGPANESTEKAISSRKFDTIQEFLNSEYNVDKEDPTSSEYHSGIRFVTDEETDRKILKAAREGAEETYDVLSENCLQNCTRPLVDQDVIPYQFGNYTLPNATFERLLDYISDRGFTTETYQGHHMWENFFMINETLREGWVEAGPVMSWSEYQTMLKNSN